MLFRSAAPATSTITVGTTKALTPPNSISDLTSVTDGNVGKGVSVSTSSSGATVTPGTVTLNDSATGTATMNATSVGIKTGSASLDGVTVPFTFTVGPQLKFTATPSGTVAPGQNASYSIAAVDPADGTTVLTNQTFQVNLTSSDSTATLPTPVTVTNGVATFNVKYNRTGNQTLTITHSQASNIKIGRAHV